MLHSEMLPMIRRLREAGCKVEHDKSAGTVVILDSIDGGLIIKAIQKGAGKAPWLVLRRNSTAQVTWEY